VKDAVSVGPSFADFQPDEVPPAYPLSGKCDVRGCFVVGHTYRVARSQLRVNMLL